ncbi:uncharacterized protein N7469_009249 [Penicillium citrinum]|uniref:Gamma-butyrobetaine dioxygenase n=1 Tax=Penicillium citrinum TaxID=5077 RepID=A0A9W9THT9_PENCI|nr:uncharacterized protein N7469_009249 [Penicillium citrinum]KAJ5223009.1 hypothetical protein N7469_009249 [Penicillium citrinum]
MRPVPSAMLRQVARRRVNPALRTLVSSAKRLNSEETPKTQQHMSELLQDAFRLESHEKQRIFSFKHPNAGSEKDFTKVELSDPAWLKAEPEYLKLQSPMHGYAAFPYYYLRDFCKCPRCVDPHSKQRSFRTSDIPAKIYPRQIEWNGFSLKIKWANDIPGYDDDHVSSLDIESLKAGPMNTHDNVSTATKPFHWGSKLMQGIQHWVSFDDYMSNDAKFAESMRNLQRLGLIFVKDIPKSRELVKKISERMGPVRNSFYGETWDVKTVPQAKNVAYTNQFLGFHMDLLYMNEPPGYQLLHCLENSCEGGESLFADSFRAASIMRKQFPSEYKTLTKRLFGFEYMHNDHIYSNVRPLFELDKMTDRIRNVNYSPPFQSPVPKYMNADGASNHVNFKAWRQALKTFTRLLESNSSVFQLKLNPGECVIFANRRIVHARNQFNTASGSRWLAGAYVDEDALLSTFATNARKFPAEWSASDPSKTGKKLLIQLQSEKEEAVKALREYNARKAEAEAAHENSQAVPAEKEG